MKIKDITIKKIENLPPHILLKVNEMIDILYEKEQNRLVQTQADRKRMMELTEEARNCLKGIHGNLSDDIINIEREYRV